VGEAHLQPSAAACITCHDSDDARAHADLNTTVDGREACGVCHGPGRESAVDVAHGL
jgi:cytochrome c553